MNTEDLKSLLSFLKLTPTKNKASMVASDLISAVKSNPKAVESYPALCLSLVTTNKSDLNSLVSMAIKENDVEISAEEIEGFNYTPFIVPEYKGNKIEDHMVFYDKKYNEVVDVNASFIKFEFQKSFPEKEMWAAYLDSAKYVKITYNPLLPRLTEGEGDMAVLNTYIKPSYLDVEPKEVPKIIFDFLDFFFPEPESQEYFLHWLYTALFSRCKQFLILIDKGGTGKSNVLFPLIRGLIGSENTVTETTSGFTGKFNGHWTYKQLIIAEELTFNDNAQKDKFKALDGEVVPIEKKGREKILADNHLSVIASTNRLNALRLDLYDRKFSIPYTSNISMEQDTKYGFDKDYIREELIQAVRDPAILRGFRDYLKSNCNPPMGLHSPFKSHMYERALLNSAPHFMQDILREILSGRVINGEIDVINLSKFYKKERRKAFPREIFEDWITLFTWNDENLGEFEDESKDVFIVDERFKGVEVNHDSYESPDKETKKSNLMEKL